MIQILYQKIVKLYQNISFLIIVYFYILIQSIFLCDTIINIFVLIFNL